jgi:hypothetical protein
MLTDDMEEIPNIELDDIIMLNIYRNIITIYKTDCDDFNKVIELTKIEPIKFEIPSQSPENKLRIDNIFKFIKEE